MLQGGDSDFHLAGCADVTPAHPGSHSAIRELDAVGIGPACSKTLLQEFDTALLAENLASDELRNIDVEPDQLALFVDKPEWRRLARYPDNDLATLEHCIEKRSFGSDRRRG